MKQLLLSLVFAGACFAQSTCPALVTGAGDYVCTSDGWKKKATLKCQKYEHEEHIDGFCHSAVCKGNFACPAIAVCDPPVDRCAPDLHTVTEKEWQELMSRFDAIRFWNISLTKRVAELEAQKRATSAPSH